MVLFSKPWPRFSGSAPCAHNPGVSQHPSACVETRGPSSSLLLSGICLPCSNSLSLFSRFLCPERVLASRTVSVPPNWGHPRGKWKQRDWGYPWVKSSGKKNRPQTPPPPKVILQVLLPPQSLVTGSAVNMTEWISTPKLSLMGKHGSMRERGRGLGVLLQTHHTQHQPQTRPLWDQEGPRQNEDPSETASDTDTDAGHLNAAQATETSEPPVQLQERLLPHQSQLWPRSRLPP